MKMRPMVRLGALVSIFAENKILLINLIFYCLKNVQISLIHTGNRRVIQNVISYLSVNIRTRELLYQEVIIMILRNILIKVELLLNYILFSNFRGQYVKKKLGALVWQQNGCFAKVVGYLISALSLILFPDSQFLPVYPFQPHYTWSAHDVVCSTVLPRFFL